MYRQYRCEKKYAMALTASLMLFILYAQSISRENILTELENEVKLLVKEVKPFVVTISAKFEYDLVESKTAESESQKNEKIPFEMENIGSGVIFDENHVVTLASIVIGSSDIHIETSDGKKFPGSVVGLDEESGIAILKTGSTGLPAAKKGASEQLQTGCWVLIVGNSLGVTPAISLGVVNAIRGDGTIQLSTNVAAGSVGGPVFNVNGELVGIVAARITQPNNNLVFNSAYIGNEGALAFPIHKLEKPINNIITQGFTNQGWIGVSAENWPGKEGWVHIINVKDNSPAKQAGLKMGDIVYTVGNAGVKDASNLASIIKEHNPEDSIILGIIRGDEKHSVKVKISKKPEDENQQMASNAPGNMTNKPANIGVVQVQGQGGSNAPQLDQEFLLMRIRNMEHEIKTLRSMLKH